VGIPSRDELASFFISAVTNQQRPLRNATQPVGDGSLHYLYAIFIEALRAFLSLSLSLSSSYSFIATPFVLFE
jgi:hypothetical protein